MKIRAKMLLLSLALALLPVILMALVSWAAMNRIKDDVLDIACDRFENGARRHLGSLVEDYGRIVRRDRHLVEKTLDIQRREVEKRLAAPPPPRPVLYRLKNYGPGGEPPPDMTCDEKYYALGPEGDRKPIRLSFDHQVFFLAADARPGAAAAMTRLSTMSGAYRELYTGDPDLLKWHYTALASGVHSSYPGHGGYPAEYDPRTREWYRRALAAAGTAWTLGPDVSSGVMNLTCSMPVRNPQGSIAGVTAIDVHLKHVLEGLRSRLPKEWRNAAEIFHVMIDGEEQSPGKRMKIFIRESFHSRGHEWRIPVELDSLVADDPYRTEVIVNRISSGHPGILRADYRGADCLWAFSPIDDEGGVATVIILPAATVVAEANRAAGVIKGLTKKAILVSAVTYLFVMVIVVGVAVSSSRRLTRPIKDLTEGAQRITEGDYESRVNIRTRDELEELGTIFNNMGPRLVENEKMKRSLAVASEIQQHLLPPGAPGLETFDIAGKIDYCDETGGDYYDFIIVSPTDADRIGIAVGDITGHGIGAALLMASARAVLRSHVPQYDEDLSGLFNTINDHLWRDTGEERFLTLCYIMINGRTRTLSYVSAGHDPALWRRGGSGEIEELRSTGIMLGALPDSTYTHSGPVTLEPGDLVVVGTDGIWEAHNPADEMYGRQRLKDVIDANASRSAEEIRDAIIASVKAFCDTAPQLDDITVVVIKAR